MKKESGTGALTCGDISDLFRGLAAIEEAVGVKLDADVRIKIAINRNLCQPIAAAFERTMVKCAAEIQAANRGRPEKERKTGVELQSETLDAIETARAVKQALELRSIGKDELRLVDNPTITGAIIQQLLPVLRGVTS